MPVIQFDVLVPTRKQSALRKSLPPPPTSWWRAVRFPQLTLLARRRRSFQRGWRSSCGKNYRDEHEDRDLADASVHRYDIAVVGVSGSVNQLGMVLSRLLTPHAVLPKDHVLLEDELAHERPAIFPWSLSIRP